MDSQLKSVYDVNYNPEQERIATVNNYIITAQVGFSVNHVSTISWR